MPMNFTDKLIIELIGNKESLEENSTPTDRVNALRKQSIILDKVTKQASKEDKFPLFKAHLDEYAGRELEDFVSDRSKNAAALIRGIPRPSLTRTLKVRDFLTQNAMSLEQSCSGKYTSCAQSKVRAEDLKIFQKIHIPVLSDKVSGTASLSTFPAENQSNLPPSVESNSSSSMDGATFLGKPGPQPTSLSRESNSKSTRQNFFQRSSNDSREPAFRTAREELILQNMKKVQPGSTSGSRNLFNYGASKKSLGARRNVRSGFVPPIRQEENPTSANATEAIPAETVHEHLQNIDPKMVELITNEIMHKYKPINWTDIAGLDYAKSTIKEAVVWPLLRPDIFTGLRRPPRGILLFGPPGTGKTLIGKCIASQSKSTFFSISASSLTSKWIGEGEKMVRALFAVAAVHQPSVIFIDEIDSLLSQRSESEHESSRRLKTEFLVQLDGANTIGDERILIVGATNRPKELDEAARRRLVRRLYIPLPELPARVQILTNLLQTVCNTLSVVDIEKIGALTDGYSGADMENLCREASMEPIRSIPPDEIPFFDENSVRPVTLKDFEIALTRVRATVSPEDISQYVEWDKTYGAGQ